MNQPALTIVAKSVEAPQKQQPKYLNQLSEDARLSEIFVYSQRDFYMGSNAHDLSCNRTDEKEALPFYGDMNLIELGGTFSKAQLDAALKKMLDGEDPTITRLRETLVDAIEAKKLFYSAVRTHEDAHEHGIVFIDDTMDLTLPLGVMAYDS